jgi:Amt family ammonium transporter
MVTDSNQDSYWITQAIVIFFAFLGLIGLSLIEAGLVRQKHHLICLLKNFVQLSVGILVFWLLGFGFLFGDNNNGYIGADLYGGEDWEGTYHYNRAAMYGLLGLYVVFIVNGALAERLHLWAYLTYAFWIMLWVYPVIGHWEWGQGWLDEELDISYIDRGGNGVVHLLAGSFAFTGLLFAGARQGKKAPKSVKIIDETYEDHPSTYVPASMELVVTGYLFLILSLFAISCFRGKDTLEDQAGAFNTLLAGSVSCIVAVVFYTIGSRDVTFHYEAVLQGFVAGEVAVTSVARNCEPWAAFCIGFIAGLLFAGTARLVKWLPRIDDVTNTIAVHFVNGIWGLLATGLFDNKRGVFHEDGEGGGGLFGSQVVGAVVITGWGLFWGIVIFGILLAIGLLRTSPEVELLGLNYASLNWKGFFIDLKKIEISRT